MLAAGPAFAADLEKTDLKFGFIKLTDMAPLAVAKEKGFFEEEGLDVVLEAQSNWKVVLDRVVSGELDGSHMLPPAILSASAGIGTAADLVTPFAMGVNTLAITVSNEVWDQMKPNVPQEGGHSKHPISAESLKPVVDAFK
ncbi:MAG: ABC transporter substrate-binding protein, partial [Gammaproteobacteria bacterium]